MYVSSHMPYAAAPQLSPVRPSAEHLPPSPPPFSSVTTTRPMDQTSPNPVPKTPVCPSRSTALIHFLCSSRPVRGQVGVQVMPTDQPTSHSRRPPLHLPTSNAVRGPPQPAAQELSTYLPTNKTNTVHTPARACKEDTEPAADGETGQRRSVSGTGQQHRRAPMTPRALRAPRAQRAPTETLVRRSLTGLNRTGQCFSDPGRQGLRIE
ncbi:hypothetical protein JOL62DRAFT_93298 [Phyllosticta paracitricarpa]|uniref:Uncharacterized protein n=1 Tax=Phyllosticta paracitricarpa TaxID=2016321 RepID=A0ABR1N6A5_9PEZI